MKTIFFTFLIGWFLPFTASAAVEPANSSTAAYYSSSPSSHSAKMNAYIHFFVAAEAGDTQAMDKLATDDITWDFDAGSEIAHGLPWIGLFKGKKAIIEVSQKIKNFKIKVLSRKYYLISENESQLIVVAKDNVKIFDSIIVPNINFANVVTFQGGKIVSIKTVEDNARLSKAYEAYQATQAVKAWSK